MLRDRSLHLSSSVVLTHLRTNQREAASCHSVYTPDGCSVCVGVCECVCLWVEWMSEWVSVYIAMYSSMYVRVCVGAHVCLRECVCVCACKQWRATLWWPITRRKEKVWKDETPKPRQQPVKRWRSLLQLDRSDRWQEPGRTPDARHSCRRLCRLLCRRLCRWLCRRPRCTVRWPN